MADVADLHQNFILYQTRQSALSFVEDVARVSASRSLHSPEERQRAGLRPGEVHLITNLGCYRFDASVQELVLVSVHPGVTLDEVRDATGFDLKISSELAETSVPSAESLRVLREEVDPLGLRRLEFVPAQDRQQLLRDCIAAEDALIWRALKIQ